MWEWFAKCWKRWTFKQRQEKVLDQCGNCCLCPACRDILNDQTECVDDPQLGVFYTCTKCGAKSHWDFDAPCPILLDFDLPSPPEEKPCSTGRF